MPRKLTQRSLMKKLSHALLSKKRLTGKEMIFLMTGAILLLIEHYASGHTELGKPTNNRSKSGATSIARYDLLECAQAVVHDGDTISAVCAGDKYRIRLQHIDAPETKQHPYGKEATEALKVLLPKTFQVQFAGNDVYGRALGTIYHGKQDINQKLLAKGVVVVYRYQGKTQAPKAYVESENQAKTQRLGVWRKSGLQQNPSKWRRLCQSEKSQVSACHY